MVEPHTRLRLPAERGFTWKSEWFINGFMNFQDFDPSKMDPSKMDPKVLMELSQLIRELPPEKLSQMQTLMHNVAAGIDVRREMEEFERSLPPGFREKLMSAMLGQGSSPFSGGSAASPGFGAQEAGRDILDHESSSESEMNLHQARMTILREVANGRVSPEDAERLLFPS